MLLKDLEILKGEKKYSNYEVMKSKRKRETNLLKPMQIVGKKKKKPKSNVFLHLLDLMSEHAAFNSNYDTVNLPTM